MSGGPSAANHYLSPNNTAPPNRNSNREALRLETPATQTKQSTEPHPNREKKPVFSAPVGEGALALPQFGPASAVEHPGRSFKSTHPQSIKILIGNHYD